MASDTWQMTPHFRSFEFESRDSCLLSSITRSTHSAWILVLTGHAGLLVHGSALWFLSLGHHTLHLSNVQSLDGAASLPPPLIHKAGWGFPWFSGGGHFRGWGEPFEWRLWSLDSDIMAPFSASLPPFSLIFLLSWPGLFLHRASQAA